MMYSLPLAKHIADSLRSELWKGTAVGAWTRHVCEHEHILRNGQASKARWISGSYFDRATHARMGDGFRRSKRGRLLRCRESRNQD